MGVVADKPLWRRIAEAPPHIDPKRFEPWTARTLWVNRAAVVGFVVFIAFLFFAGDPRSRVFTGGFGVLFLGMQSLFTTPYQRRQFIGLRPPRECLGGHGQPQH
jgi:hypothetical protein